VDVFNFQSLSSIHERRHRLYPFFCLPQINPCGVSDAYTMPNPTLILVPGSFARADLYDTFVEKMKPNGLEFEVVDLPSTMNRSPEAPATVADDAAAIQAVASKYIEQGKEVHIHTHSYGGIPGTESIKGISKSAREARGLKGGVCRIVYTTALAVPVGVGLKDGMGDHFPDFITVQVR